MQEESAQPSEALVEVPEEAPDDPPPILQDPPLQAKKKGRPLGVKDRIPRTKKKVEIVVEPLVARSEPIEKVPKVEKAVAHFEHDPYVPAVEEEPKSPRTLLRETSAHLLPLKGIVHDRRRVSVADAYVDRLSNWPLV